MTCRHGAGEETFFWHPAWSETGLIIDHIPSRFTGGESFWVKNLETLDLTNLIWLYKGVVMRKGEDIAAKKHTRDEEFAACWKKRWPHFLLRRYPQRWTFSKEKLEKLHQEWLDAPVGNDGFHKDPGRYYGGMGAVSPDLKYCYLYESDEVAEGPIVYYEHRASGRYQVLDLETGKRTPIPAWVDGQVNAPNDISHDRRYITAYGKDGPIVALRETWQTVRRFPFEEAPQDYFFSPDSRMLAVFSTGSASIFDIERNRRVAHLGQGDFWKSWWHPKSDFPMIREIEFSPDSRYLWVYRGRPGFQSVKPEEHRTNVLWDIAKDRAVKGLSEEQVERMEGFGPLPGTVLLGAKDRLQLVHIATGTELAHLLLPPGSPPRRYVIVNPPDPKRNERNTWYITWEFRALSRPDGLVVVGMEDKRTETQTSETVYFGPGDSRTVRFDKPVIRDVITKRLVNWNLAPHLNAIKAQIAELESSGRR